MTRADTIRLIVELAHSLEDGYRKPGATLRAEDRARLEGAVRGFAENALLKKRVQAEDAAMLVDALARLID